LGGHQRSSKEYLRTMQEQGVREGLSKRDAAFGDYREGAKVAAPTKAPS
jgi:hypothetical protein